MLAVVVCLLAQAPVQPIHNAQPPPAQPIHSAQPPPAQPIHNAQPPPAQPNHSAHPPLSPAAQPPSVHPAHATQPPPAQPTQWPTGAHPPAYGYMPVQPPYAPYPYGPPPMSADQRMDLLEQRLGSRYPRSKGTGMLVGGGLTLGFGAVLGLSTLACMVTAAALYDSGDYADARPLRGISLGLGIATVAALGAGIPLVIVGKQRRLAYRAWLEQHPLAIGAGGLSLRF